MEQNCKMRSMSAFMINMNDSSTPGLQLRQETCGTAFFSIHCDVDSVKSGLFGLLFALRHTWLL